ncbi:MAG: organic hydroperoxide resistance protein [Corynebacterium sp.]|nr:organic hydroperoxide resistance protein [Corynebacterium sp.]
MEPIYTAEVLATGEGRGGHVRSTDGLIDFALALPKEMGGAGDAPNPELLFAAGYAACFHGALKLVARNENVAIDDSTIGARVTIGKLDNGGFGLAVELEITIPELEHEKAVDLANKAHEVCPYSNATRGNIEVKITVTED